MSKLWYDGSYKRLEELLREMRETRRNQWWHVYQRYIAAERRVIEVRYTRKNKAANPILPPHHALVDPNLVVIGSVGSTTVPIAVYRWSPKVRMEKVRRGVDWLTCKMYNEGGAWLPREILERVA
jgi:hypothetical protein